MSYGKNTKATIRVGIVGFGVQGQWHFTSLWAVPPFEVVWVFDQNYQRTTNLSQPLRVRSLEDALRRDAQLVVVATPPSSHFNTARSLLLAGKNVVMEKPTTVSDSETRRLLEMARRRQLVVLTHFSRRWDSDFLAVKTALSTYDFGLVHEIESRVTDAYTLGESYPRRERWKSQYPGGGILLDWAPHLLDQTFALMGRRRPQYVYCSKDRPNRIVDPRLEEQFIIHVKYRDCLVVLGASWNAGLTRPRWMVWGTRAALLVDKIGEVKGMVKWRRGDQTVTQQLDSPHALSKVEAFRALVQMSIQNRKTPGEEAKRMRMVSYGIDLARRSYLKGKLLAWEL